MDGKWLWALIGASTREKAAANGPRASCPWGRDTAAAGRKLVGPIPGRNFTGKVGPGASATIIAGP